MKELTSRYLKIFLLLLVIYAVAVAFSGKPNAEQGKQQPELKMSLSSSTLMLCLGSPLRLDLEIENHGIQRVKIDKVDLWNEFRYGFSGKNGSGRGGGQGFMRDQCRGNFVVLEPGDRYNSSFEYPMDDFFKDAGKYTIRMVYEDISTNELSFELYDCNPQ